MELSFKRKTKLFRSRMDAKVKHARESSRKACIQEKYQSVYVASLSLSSKQTTCYKQGLLGKRAMRACALRVANGLNEKFVRVLTVS